MCVDLNFTLVMCIHRSLQPLQVQCYIHGPPRVFDGHSRVLLNGIVLQATTSSSGCDFCRSVVSVECDYVVDGDVTTKFTEYGIARFFAEVELFAGV